MKDTEARSPLAESSFRGTSKVTAFFYMYQEGVEGYNGEAGEKRSKMRRANKM